MGPFQLLLYQLQPGEGCSITELSLPIDASWQGQPLRRVALGALQMSYGQFKRAKFQGQLLLDGVPVHADARVQTGQLLVIRIPEGEKACPLPYPLPLSVPYQHLGLLLVDKPAPLPSVASRSPDQRTLENALYAHLGCPDPFVYHPVNRLDKGTSGLMAVALTAHVQQLLQQTLHTDAFIRRYLAVCEGAPPQREGVIDAPIAKESGPSVRRRVAAEGKPATTLYRVLETAGSRSLVELQLQTGRTHQIRVHLSWLGCPVVGDFLYGREEPSLPGRFALHSHFLRLTHPLTGQEVTATSPLPQALQQLLLPRQAP